MLNVIKIQQAEFSSVGYSGPADPVISSTVLITGGHKRNDGQRCNALDIHYVNTYTARPVCWREWIS